MVLALNSPQQQSLYLFRQDLASFCAFLSILTAERHPLDASAFCSFSPPTASASQSILHASILTTLRSHVVILQLQLSQLARSSAFSGSEQLEENLTWPSSSLQTNQGIGRHRG